MLGDWRSVKGASYTQGMLGNIYYPRGFGRPYRCIVTHCDGYTMEEYSTSLVIGCLVAREGPQGFQRLWGLIVTVARHYLFNFNPTNAEKQKAARSMAMFNAELEKLIIRGKVRHVQNLPFYVGCQASCDVALAMLIRKFKWVLQHYLCTSLHCRGPQCFLSLLCVYVQVQ